MKKSNYTFVYLITFSFLFIFSNPTYSQGWEKIWGGVDNEIGYSVRQCDDGGYVFVASGESFGTGILVVKTDSNGDTIWTKNIGDPAWISWDVSYSIFQTNDGGYVITGEFWGYGASLNIGDVFLLKLDSNGSILWTRIYSNPNAIDVGTSVIQTIDGGFIMSALGSSSSGTTDIDNYVIKTDSAGILTWTKSYVGYGSVSAESIQQTADSGFVICGYIDTPLDSNGVFGNTSGLFINKLDVSGNSEWVKIFSNFKTGFSSAISYIEQTNDGGFVVVGGVNRDSIIYSKTYILKLDANGDTLWSRVFDLQGGINYAESVLETDNGTIVLTGSSYDSLNVIREYLIKTDNLGNLIWIKYINDNTTGCEVHQTSDSGFIIIGGIYQQNNWDIYLVKTDSSGNVVQTGFDDINYIESDIQFYPNPCSNSINIKINQTYRVSGSICIYNIFGQKLYCHPKISLSSELKHTIDLDFLSSGVYFIELLIDGERTIEKIVKE